MKWLLTALAIVMLCLWLYRRRRLHPLEVFACLLFTAITNQTVLVVASNFHWIKEQTGDVGLFFLLVLVRVVLIPLLMTNAMNEMRRSGSAGVNVLYAMMEAGLLVGLPYLCFKSGLLVLQVAALPQSLVY